MLSSIHRAAGVWHLDYEIIVVDDSSTDKTSEVARTGGATVLPMAFRHIAAARNAGANMARGQTLIFVDADTRIPLELLGGALNALALGAVGGGAPFRFHGATPWTERLAAWAIGVVLRLGGIAPGCFVYCQRRTFDAVGGFNESLFAAEDVAISWALAKHGRFVILRQHALTSDRKMRTHGWRDHLTLFGRLARRGLAGLRDRDDLGVVVRGSSRSLMAA